MMIPSERMAEYLDIAIAETENEIKQLKGKIEGLYMAKDNLQAAIYTTEQNNKIGEKSV